MTAMTTTTATARPARPAATSAATGGSKARRVARAKAVGLVVALNTVIYLVASAAGAEFLLADPGKPAPHHMILPEVAGPTLVIALLGWGSLALLERFTRRARTVWTVLAVVVTVLSMPPIFNVQVQAATSAALVVIHLAVAAVLIPAFRRTSARA